MACAIAAGASGGVGATVVMNEAPWAQGLAADVREAVHHALIDGDAHGRPFAVVDKKQARLLVFGADGKLVGAAPALLGQAPGDHAVPGLGLRPVGAIAVHERTTPAGRFESAPGHNHHGEANVWIDYDAALAIHRLRPAAARERRPQRLASPNPGDHRITLGCVVVDPAFYDAVVAPTLGRQPGVVYVLPETSLVPRPPAVAVTPAVVAAVPAP